MSYLATARSVVTGYERNESDEITPALTGPDVSLALVALQDEIVAAASAAQARFDRQRYDELWHHWYVLQEKESAA